MMGLILALLAKIQQVLGKIGNGGDAAAMDGTLFAGQQAIFDAVGGISGSPVVIAGACDAGMSGSTTTVVSADLAGYGDDYFNGNWHLQVVKNDNSIGGAPTGEIRQVTDYVSATGTFTCDAFSANVEAGDGVVLVHRNLGGIQFQEFTSGSGNWTVPAGVDFCQVLAVGGGGGGAACDTAGGPGGGGGEIVFHRAYPLRGETSIPYAVGVGGVGGTAPGRNAGGNGGNSSFGNIIAHGGNGGGDYHAEGGFGGMSTRNSSQPYGSGYGVVDNENGGVGGGTWGFNSSYDGNGFRGKIIDCGLVLRLGGGGGSGRIGSSDSREYHGGQCIGSGGNSPFGNVYYGGGGGASWGDGGDGGDGSPAAGDNAAANSGGGGGGGAANNWVTGGDGGNGGSGYILIMWKG